VRTVDVRTDIGYDRADQRASFRRLSACGRPKLLSAQIRMGGCLSALRMASGWTLAAWSKLIPSDSR